MVRGGFGTRMKPILQTGNFRPAQLARPARRASRQLYRGGHAPARLELFRRADAIYGVTHLAALMRLLPERVRTPNSLKCRGILDRLEDPVLAAAWWCGSKCRC